WSITCGCGFGIVNESEKLALYTVGGHGFPGLPGFRLSSSYFGSPFRTLPAAPPCPGALPSPPSPPFSELSRKTARASVLTDPAVPPLPPGAGEGRQASPPVPPFAALLSWSLNRCEGLAVRKAPNARTVPPDPPSPPASSPR